MWCVVNACPHLFTAGNERVRKVKKAGWAQGRSRRFWNILPTVVFEPSTVHPIARRCTDCAIPDVVFNGYQR